MKVKITCDVGVRVGKMVVRSVWFLRTYSAFACFRIRYWVVNLVGSQCRENDFSVSTCFGRFGDEYDEFWNDSFTKSYQKSEIFTMETSLESVTKFWGSKRWQTSCHPSHKIQTHDDKILLCPHLKNHEDQNLHDFWFLGVRNHQNRHRKH